MAVVIPTAAASVTASAAHALNIDVELQAGVDAIAAATLQGERNATITMDNDRMDLVSAAFIAQGYATERPLAGTLRIVW